MSGDTSSENLPTSKSESGLEALQTPVVESAESNDLSPSHQHPTGSSVWNLSPLPIPSDQAVDLRDITPSISPVFTEDQVRELSQHAGEIDVTHLLPPDTFKRITEVLTPEQTNLLISTCTANYSDHDVSMSYTDPLLGPLGNFASPLKHGTETILPEDLPKIDLSDELFSGLDPVVEEEKTEKVSASTKSEDSTTVVTSTVTTSTSEVTSSSPATTVAEATSPDAKSTITESKPIEQKEEIKDVSMQDKGDAEDSEAKSKHVSEDKEMQDGETQEHGETLQKDNETKNDGETQKDSEAKKDGETQKDVETKKDGETQGAKLSPPKPSYSLRSSPRKSQPPEKTSDISPSRHTRQKSQKADVAMETRRSPRGHKDQPEEETKSPVRGRRGRKKEEAQPHVADEGTPKEEPTVRRSARIHHDVEPSPPKQLPESPRRGRGRRKAATPAEEKEAEKDEPMKEKAAKDEGSIQEDTIDSSVTLPSEIKDTAEETLQEEKVSSIEENQVEEKKEVLSFAKEEETKAVEETKSQAAPDSAVPEEKGKEGNVEVEILRTDTEGESSSTEEKLAASEKVKPAKKERKREKKEDLQPSRRSNRISESIRKREIEEAVRIAQEEMRREREEEDRKIQEEEKRIRKEKEEEERKLREEELEKQRQAEEEARKKEEEEKKKQEEEELMKKKDEETEEEKVPTSPKIKKPTAQKGKGTPSPIKKAKMKTIEDKEEKEKEDNKTVKEKKMKKDRAEDEKKPVTKTKMEPKEKILKKHHEKAMTAKEKMEELKKEKLKKVEEILSQQAGSNLFEFHQLKKEPSEKKKEEKEEKEEEEPEPSSDEEEVPGDDDSDYDPENDPERLWCICRKPHGNRFMICCDLCEDWFHGDCVGITMQMGRQMEKTGIEYTCPKCLKVKKARKDNALQQELASDSPVKTNPDNTPVKRPRRHTRLKIPKDSPEDKSPVSKGHLGTKIKEGSRKKEEGASKVQSKDVPKRRSSDSTGYKIPKKVRTTPTPASFSSRIVMNNKCIQCGEATEGNSRYCGDKCIGRHAEESLKALSEERKKRLGSHNQKSATSPTSSLHIAMPWESSAPHSTSSSPRVSERVAVIEKSTGRVIAGVAAPTEGQLFYWLQKHPTFEVLKQTPAAPKEEKKKENKKEEEKGVRENVKRHLKEILQLRLKESKEYRVSEEEIIKFSLDIEEELFKHFGDAGHRYKNKYRSLAFNLKDRRNKVLFHHVMNGEVSTERLVGMTPEQLASQELARWRERETKHTLDMIKQNLEDINPAKGHIKKTHKGEVELDEDEDFSNLEVHTIEPKAQTAAADSNTSPGPLLLDTTEQHRVHLFDLNCRICTGKMAPPGEVPHTDAPEPAPIMVSTTSPIIALAESSVPSPPPIDMTDVSSSDSLTVVPGSPPQKSTKREQNVWKGFVMMQSVAKFGTNAYKVSGPCDDLLQLLPDTLHLQGRIGFDQVWDYVYQLRNSTSRVVSVIRYEPSAEDEKTGYVSMYSYFYSRKRCGVVSNCYSGVKDMYLVPLASHAAIPKEILPFDGPGLDEPRPHMLLGLIVRTRPSFKRPRPVSSRHRSSSPKAKRKHQHHSSIKRSDSDEVKPLKDSPPPEIDDIVFQFHSAQAKKTTETEEKPSDSSGSGGGNSAGSSGTSSPALSRTASTEAIQPTLAALLAEKQQLLLLQEKANLLKKQNEQNTKPSDEDTPYDPEEDFDLDLELEKPVNDLMDSKTPVISPPPVSQGGSPNVVSSSTTSTLSTIASLPAAAHASSKPTTAQAQLTPSTSTSSETSTVAFSAIARPAKPPLLPASLVFPIDMSSSHAAELIKRLSSKPGGIQPPITTSAPSSGGTTTAGPTPASSTTSTLARVTASSGEGGKGRFVPIGSQEAVIPVESAGVSPKESSQKSPVAPQRPAEPYSSPSPRVDTGGKETRGGFERKSSDHAMEHGGDPVGINRRQTSDPGPPPRSYPDPPGLDLHRRSSASDHPEVHPPDLGRRPVEGPPLGDAQRGPQEHRGREQIDRERLEWRERFSHENRREYDAPSEPIRRGPLSQRGHDQRDRHGPQRNIDERGHNVQRIPPEERDPRGQRPEEREPPGHLPRRPSDDRGPRRSLDERDPHGPRRPSDERESRDGPWRPLHERDQRDPHGPMPRRPSDDRYRDPYGHHPREGDRGRYEPYRRDDRHPDRRDGRRFEENRWRDRWRR